MNSERHLTGRCLELLGDQVIGRLAVIVGGRPEICPINHVLDGDAVVFRSNSGTKLAGTTQAEVAFEVDFTHSQTMTGWSVVVHGIAQEITPSDRATSRSGSKALPLGVWAPGRAASSRADCGAEITGRQVGPRLGLISAVDGVSASAPSLTGRVGRGSPHLGRVCTN